MIGQIPVLMQNHKKKSSTLLPLIWGYQRGMQAFLEVGASYREVGATDRVISFHRKEATDDKLYCLFNHTVLL